MRFVQNSTAAAGQWAVTRAKMGRASGPRVPGFRNYFPYGPIGPTVVDSVVDVGGNVVVGVVEI